MLVIIACSDGVCGQTTQRSTGRTWVHRQLRHATSPFVSLSSGNQFMSASIRFVCILVTVQSDDLNAELHAIVEAHASQSCMFNCL